MKIIIQRWASGPVNRGAQLAKDRLKAAYAGLYGEPQDDTPKPEAGKNVWVIAYDLSHLFAQQFVAGAKEAGKTLDWNVKVFNGKGDPNEALAGIRGAFATKADGMVIEAFDCDLVKSGVEQVLAAGVEVIGDLNKDCSPAISRGLLAWAPNERSFGSVRRRSRTFGRDARCPPRR